MTIQKEALDKILELHASTLTLPETLVPIVALPDKVDVQSLERYLSNRVRFRGAFATSILDSFVEYVNKRADYSCFVDPESMGAEAIFNIGTLESPGHCDDTAKLKMATTAPYRALLAVNGKRLGQKEAAEWLEDWRNYIVVIDSDGEAITLPKACAALRSMTVERVSKVEREVGDFHETGSMLESVTAKAKNEAQPAAFSFECEPYMGLELRRIEVRISAVIERGEVSFSYRIMRHEDLVEKMALELADRLTESLSISSNIYVGKFTA